MQTSHASNASTRKSWVLLTAALLLLAIVAQPTLGLREEGNPVSAYEAVVEGDTISILELVHAEEDDDDDADDPGEEFHIPAAWSRLRSLLAAKKPDCREPVKKKSTCRKPSPKPPPPPPPPPVVEEEYTYEAPELPYEAPNVPEPSPVPTPVPSPPPPSIVYNQVVCDYAPRRRILSGPRMVRVEVLCDPWSAVSQGRHPPTRRLSHSLARSFVFQVPNGGMRACTCLHVVDAGACCQTCRDTFGCNGWMYTKPLDCRVFGQPNPENVCYMLSDATGSYVRHYLGGQTHSRPDPLPLTRSLAPSLLARTLPCRSSSTRAARHSTETAKFVLDMVMVTQTSFYDDLRHDSNKSRYRLPRPLPRPRPPRPPRPPPPGATRGGLFFA